MKKFPKMLAVGAMALCSCFSFVGCNEDATPPANPDTEQQTPSTDNNNPGGTSGLTQEQLNAQRFDVFKTAITKTTDPTNYKKGFTVVTSEVMTEGTVIDEENFNPTGDTWTDETKTAFIAGLKDEGMGETETEKNKIAYSWDGTNKVAYTINYDIAEDNTETIKDFEKIVSKDNVYTLYGQYYQSETYTNRYKYNIDDKYYTNYIEDFEKEMMPVLLMFKQETIEDLPVAVLSQMEMPEDIEYTYSAEFTETDGKYNVLVTVNIPDFDPTLMGSSESLSLTNANMCMKIGFVYDANGIQKMTGNVDFGGDMTMPVDDSNNITIKMIEKMDEEMDFSFAYNADLVPQFNDTDRKETDFNDHGNVDMRIYYYINGYKIDASDYNVYGDEGGDIIYDRGKYNADVCLLQLGDDIENSESLKWYVDPECTIEFNETKYPSIDLKLYAKVTLAEGKAFVRTKAVDSASEIADLEDDDYSAGEIVDVTEVYEDLDIMENTQSAYVNGTHVSSGKIYLTEKTFNTIVFIRKQGTDKPSFPSVDTPSVE